MPSAADASDGTDRSVDLGAMLAKLDLSPEQELRTGHQSRVFRVVGRSGLLVAKVVDARDADPAYRDRVELVAALAEIEPAVIGPVAIGSRLVHEVDGHMVVCYPLIEGTTPNTAAPRTVEAMASGLARLHLALKGLSAPNVPAVRALRGDAPDRLRANRLIHGDYAATNLISTRSGLRVIDFDDCGHGSVEYELGNTLYMARFDAWNNGDEPGFDRFRSWFMDAYRVAADMPIDDGLVDEAIRVRAAALHRWLIEPSDAPLGIRNATPTWRARLRLFLDDVLT